MPGAGPLVGSTEGRETQEREEEGWVGREGTVLLRMYVIVAGIKQIAAVYHDPPPQSITKNVVSTLAEHSSLSLSPIVFPALRALPPSPTLPGLRVCVSDSGPAAWSTGCATGLLGCLEELRHRSGDGLAATTNHLTVHLPEVPTLLHYRQAASILRAPYTNNT